LQGPAAKDTLQTLTGVDLSAIKYYDAYVNGEKAGVVTSGTQTPYLKKAIGMAYLPVQCTEPGTEFAVEIRGRRAKAAVVPMPFYKRAK
jgi:aminomethyltransferase